MTEQTEKIIVYRTPKLWLQYIHMVDILKKLIKAERLGNWDLHLEATQKMLPYLAATGHNLYVKSLCLYVDKMNRLSEEHPDVHQHFKDGLHVARRSDRQWAGLSSDLIIEQVLMRCLKTSGGLTRGRGMTEQQRTIWTLSMPICASINHSMQELSGVIQSTGEQNQDMTTSRQDRDWKDTCTIAQFLTNSQYGAERRYRATLRG